MALWRANTLMITALTLQFAIMHKIMRSYFELSTNKKRSVDNIITSFANTLIYLFVIFFESGLGS